LIFDFLRHHEEGNNDRPLFFDHSLACGLIGAASLGLSFTMPKYWFIGGFLGFAVVAPSTWWIWKTGLFNYANRPANIFY
jgi:hypothetical protein